MAVENYIKNSPNNPNRHFTNLYISKLYFDTLDIKRQINIMLNLKYLFEQFAKLLIPRIYMSNKEAQYIETYESLDYVLIIIKISIDDSNF